MTETVTETHLPGLELLNRGKVRDIYDLGEQLLIVTTDRISAFDHILPDPIPGKGQVLTTMSEHWFGITKHIVPNHLITTDVDSMGPKVSPHREILRGRTMLVHKADRIDAECVARGYITGSGWLDYQRDQAICGISLPGGMVEAEPFEETLFTPATKAEIGHDENIGFDALQEIVGNVAHELRDLTLAVYEFGRDFAKARGIIVADTKFEFGYVNGEVTLIDEILTPDSSRFWGMDEYQVGMSPPSFDKQIVRNHLIDIKWDREPPVPRLPKDVIHRTTARYREIQGLLTK